MSSKPLPLMTYKEAKSKANPANPKIVYFSDAGDGWFAEVYYCPKRNRQVWTTINPEGTRII